MNKDERLSQHVDHIHGNDNKSQGDFYPPLNNDPQQSDCKGRLA